MIQNGNATLLQRFPKDYFAADVDRSKCLYATSFNALFCMHYVGNVIYHKFAHGDVSYRFNGKNIKVMLEYMSRAKRICVFEHSLMTSTAHAQRFRGARDLAFCLKVPLDSLFVWASSEGSGETARMRRLAWTFAARIGDK